MPRLAPTALALFLVACPQAPSGTDGGPDAGLDGGADAGPLPPLALEFEPMTLPTTKLRSALESDGTTLFSLTTSGVEASDDLGRAWAVRSTTPVNALFSGPGVLYALSSQALRRSVDGARTFTDVTLPAETPASGVPQVTVTSDGALWLTTRNGPLAVARSDDGGTSFAPVPVPMGATRLDACRSLHPSFVAVQDGVTVVRSDDGTGFTALGPIASPEGCLVTATGAVLVSGRDTTPYELRLAPGATTWDRTELTSAVRYAARGGALVRWTVDGRISESTDDGVTWSPRSAAAPTGFAVDGVVLAQGTVVALSNQGVALLPPGATAWELRVEPGVPLFLRVVDVAFASQSPATALLLEDNVRRTLYLAEDGVTWKRGLTFDVADAQTIALSPEGGRVFFGRANGLYTLVADAGTEVTHVDTIHSAAGFVERNTVQQAAWGADPSGSYVMVSTADDADTSGSVWLFDAESPDFTWVERRPFRTTTAAGLRLGGYHALAIRGLTAEPNRELVTGLRSFVSTNSYLNWLLTWPALFDANRDWTQDAPPVAPDAPLTASFQAADGRLLAVLWPENRLWVGPNAAQLREVPLPQGLPAVRVARFGHDDRLVLGTAGGLWRSKTVPALP